MRLPLVSIVVPAYNVSNYVKEAFQGIYSQDYPDYEVIVVDDGSSDGTYEQLEELRKVYGFRLLRQENKGVSAALNNGLQYAEGKYILTPDPDDVLVENSVSVRVKYLEEHPEVGCVGGGLICIDGCGRVIKESSPSAVTKYTFDDVLPKAIVIGAPTSMYRASAMKEVGFYDPAIRIQDFQITLKISHAGYEIHEIPSVVVRYRRYPGNLSKKYKFNYEQNMRALHPYVDCVGYDKAVLAIKNKALKYAVADDKRFAFQLLRTIPFESWDKNTARRLFKLVRHLFF